MPISTHYPSNRRAYIITGSTSGIGLATASELAKHGTLVLVGRDRAKLGNVQKTIEQRRLAPLWRHYMQAGVEAAARVAEDQ